MWPTWYTLLFGCLLSAVIITFFYAIIRHVFCNF